MSQSTILTFAVSAASIITFLTGDSSLANFSFARASILSCAIFFPVTIVWSLFLYPFYFSPLLRAGIPQAPTKRGIVLRPVKPHDILEWMDTIPNDGLIRYLDFLNRESLLVTSTHGIAEQFQIKNSHYVKRPKIVAIMRNIVGNGLVNAGGAEHKRQRKALTPAFNFRIVKELYPLFWTKACEMATLMREHIERNSGSGSPRSAPVHMDDWATRASLDIIGQAGFGNDFQSLANPDTFINTSYRDSFVLNESSRLHFILSLATHPKLVNYLPIDANRKLQAGIAAVNNFINTVIKQRYSETEDEKIAHHDIMSVAMNTGAFDTEQLLDQAKTMLAAGHETSATAVEWGILSLSHNPEVQRKLRAEIRAHLPSPASGTQVTAEMLDHLPYLNAVSKETMRVYAPVPLTGRISAQTTELCGVRVPKGTQVMAFPWAINRSRKLWGEDAREFRPERWLESAGEGYQTGGAEPMAYMTFGYGARMCIGKSFAQAENKALLAALIGSFEFTPLQSVDQLRIMYGITARIVGGLEVQATIVEGW